MGFGQRPVEDIGGVRVRKTFALRAGVPGLRFFSPRLSATWAALCNDLCARVAGLFPERPLFLGRQPGRGVGLRSPCRRSGHGVTSRVPG